MKNFVIRKNNGQNLAEFGSSGMIVDTSIQVQSGSSIDGSGSIMTTVGEKSVIGTRTKFSEEIH